MSAFSLSRRAALSAVAALAIPIASPVQRASAQPQVRFRNIVVDVSPLRSSSGDPTADWVSQELPGALAQALAPYMAPSDRGGATLVARVDLIYLGPSSGGTGPWGSTQDTISGVLVVRGARGGLAADTPLRAITSYFPNATDLAQIVQTNHWRVSALAQAFAGWAPRQLGL
jgi:hypothetical protein